MTKEEKISLLEQEGFKQKGDTYEQTFLIKYGNPYLGYGHFDRDEFFKYRNETYSITEFEKENDNKTEKRYVITNKNGELINVSLGKLKYYDRENKGLFKAEEECINKFAEYGITLNKGDVWVCLGYIPSNEQVNEMVQNAKKSLNNRWFEKRSHHLLDHCGHEKQAQAIDRMFNGGRELGEDDYSVVPFGVNSSHEQYIVDNFAKPILTTLIKQELEKGRYFDSNFVKIAGHEASEQNYKNYINKLTPKKLVNEGVKLEVANNIISRIKNGEEVKNYDRISNVQDAVKLAKRFAEAAKKANKEFDKNEFIEDYVFSGYQSAYNQSSGRFDKIGSYSHLMWLSKEPESLHEIFMQQRFFDEFKSGKNISQAVSNSYIYDNFDLELDHFEEESKNIIKSYFDNGKLHYEDFMKNISTEEERLNLLNRSINSFFNSVENNFSTWREKQNINAKDQLYQILGRSFSKHRATFREENLDIYLCPLIGEYVSQMPEFKPIADKMLNILEKQKEYVTEWTKNHFDTHIIFNEQETEVYRYSTPEREISLLTNDASTLENKVALLDKIEMMDFNKPESIQEFKKELYDLPYIEKKELIEKGKYIEEFLKDEDLEVMCTLIENKYGKDKFINTDKWQVALELVENFGYGNFRFTYDAYPDNMYGEVSESIAKQGWGVDACLKDKRTRPQEAAEEWLKDNNMTIDQYIEKYPERCFVYENRYKKEIEERKAIAKMACEKMDDVKDRITEQQEKEHLAVQSQIK